MLMINDCIFYSTKTPNDLKEILSNNRIVYPIGITSGVSCNYVNGKYINITVIADLNKQKLDENNSLIGIISRIKPENLLEIAFCIKLYNDLLFYNYSPLGTGRREEKIRKIFFNKFNPDENYTAIKPFLNDSRGWLVWRYQLYNILSLAVYSDEKINTYIKGMNMKKTEVIEVIQDLKINDLCVYDIIRELSLPTSCMTFIKPNLKDALILNNELKLF